MLPLRCSEEGKEESGWAAIRHDEVNIRASNVPIISRLICARSREVVTMNRKEEQRTGEGGQKKGGEGTSPRAGYLKDEGKRREGRREREEGILIGWGGWTDFHPIQVKGGRGGGS